MAVKFAEDVRYTQNHEWIRQDGDEYIVGISDYAQDELGDIVFVELPDVGQGFDAGQAFSVVESVKTASDIYMPVAATVTAVNEALRDAPELINQDPFGKGWIVRISVNDTAQLESLLDHRAYRDSTGV
ncbi:MAG: glycine cleavage system protein GcvH [Spirochaetaceae bacterium]|nr:MAG: glycine cleavage system protein GcvH [Spirochaetaceae bacterium]